MNVRTAKKPEARFSVGFHSSLGMQMFGNDNLYPQHLLAITSASGTAELCLGRYAHFIEGNGFADETTADMEVNRTGGTMDDLLRACAKDLARFGGFALHVNFDVFGDIVEVQHVPFENCRLAEADKDGVVSEVLVHPDWSGNLHRGGERVRVDETQVERFAVWNPIREVVMAQIEACGGIENYKGQVMYVSNTGGLSYPIPIYDAIVTEMSTDEGLGNIKNRNARNNFLTSCMMVARKSMYVADDGREEEREMISPEDLKAFQGDTNVGKILYVEVENDEDEPKVVELPVKNYDKDFTVTEESTIERIYAQFHQELFHAIRIGKLGFSGQVMKEAYEYYAGMVTTEQRMIERAFGKIFGKEINLAIEPIKYISANGTSANI